MCLRVEDLSIGEGSEYSQKTESEEGWEDLEPDTEEVAAQDLFNLASYHTVEELVQRTKEVWGVDLLKLKQDFHLDFLGIVKLVNYIRSSSDGSPPDLSSKELWEDDRYLKPVLEGDALLYALDGVLEGMEKSSNSADEKPEGVDVEKRALLSRINDLTNQMQKLEARWQNYKKVVDEQLDQRWQGTDTSHDEVDPQSAQSQGGPKVEDNDYFKGYSYTEIHETMLKDSVRTDAYRDFIYNNKNLFKDRIVLDVGCGTGILSLFAARAGAKKVIAVDQSEIIQKARANVFENDLQNVIDCLHGTIETLTLPVEKVDIIISEWMGYALLFEAMLPSVLFARDRYLAPNGLMVPSHTTLRIAPYADPDYITEHLSFWKDVYGFKMSSMLEGAYDEAIIMQVPKTTIVGAGQTFWSADLHTVTIEDLQFRQKTFQVNISEPIDRLDGFVVWFDTFFATHRGASLDHATEAKDWTDRGKTAFSTGPDSTRTHWQQAVLLTNPDSDETSSINENPPAPKDADNGDYAPRTKDKPPTQLEKTGIGEVITGDISFMPTKEDKRALNICIRWTSQKTGLKREQEWALV